MLHHIIYFSKAVRQMNEDDLVQLLKESKDWNDPHKLTGMLVYMQGGLLSRNEGRFMQVIEGERNEIDYIFEKIKKDHRHQQITILHYEPITKRDFETWLMGFETVNAIPNEKVKGFFELDDSFLKSDEFVKSNMALNFLKSFYSTDINVNAR
jgi:hypothetical protein